jgi:endoglucanase Acf2
VSAGDWDVTFRLRDAVGPQFDATFTEGSPFTFIRSHMDTLSAALPDKASATPVTCSTTCGSALLITAPRSRYLLVSPIKDAFRVNGSIISMRFTQDQTQMTIAAVASNSDPAAYLASAMRPFTGTRAEYSVTAAQVTTTFRFPQETLMGVLPHQYISLVPPVGKVIGTFDTVHGPIRLIAGSTFRTALPRPSILPSLPPLKALQSDQSLVTQLRTDINATIPPAGDVYSGGKDVLRTAMLVELAGLLGNNDLRAQAVTKARAALGTFCTAGTEDTFSLAYDANAGGLIAFPPAFGSEHYNDHHFHYGYLIHAAAIVAMFDPALPGQYGDCVKLLMRDIASSNRADPSFPYLRYFDPYAGHSWAGGLTLFGDGNNQESVSEAAHAWYAMALYGRATGDVATENLGTWLYAQESQSERLYWLNNLPSADVLPANFPYPMLSIIWGGKADYATFFDGSDPAVRGIQFFPITTSLFSVLSRSVNSRLIAPIIGPAEKNIWKSGLSMIDAFYNPNAGIPADWPIDPAYSRTYVNYWQQAAKILGEPVASMGSCAGTVFSKNGKLTGAVYRFPRDPAQCSFTLNGRTVTLGSLVTGWNVRTW